MSQSTASAACVEPIYELADLLDPRVYDFAEGATVEVCHGSLFFREVGYHVYESSVRGDDPVAVAAVCRRVIRRRDRASLLGDPILSAEALGRKVRDRRPMSSAALLADPAFAALARRAAEQGRKFTAELLEWEKKAAVMEAVSQVREVVERERAAERARREALAAEAEAKADRERPTVEAVLEAYGSCGYRVCSQGHETRVELSGPDATHRSAVRADVRKGERYSSRVTWAKQDSLHALTVPADWLESVRGLGLATFAGRLVLEAREHGHTADGEGAAYRVLTVRQGRGTSLEAEWLTAVRGRDGAARPAGKGERLVTFSDPRVAHDALIDAGLVAC